MKSKQLREQLARVAQQMNDLHEKAETEDRGFDASEQETWGNLMSEYESLESRVANAERIEKFERTNHGAAGDSLPGITDDPNDDDTPAEIRTLHEGRALDEYRSAYRKFLKGERISTEERELLQQYQAEMETRALAAGTDSAGGFTVPEGFAGYITERLIDFSGLYGAALGPNGPTLLRTASGNNIPFPTNDDTGNAGVILAENGAVTEQDTVFGERTLGAYMYTSKLIRVSLQLLQDEAVNLEQYLGRILGKRLGRALSPHLAIGTGSGQPTGIATAATDGAVNISVAAGVTYDNLVDLEHALDPAYRGSAQWVFNDSIVKGLKKLVDTNARPLWLPGDAASLAAGGAGPTLNGYGYIVDQGMESLVIGDKPIAFGDLSEYIVREVLGVNLFRFGERYMDNLQIGFMGYARWDGNLIDVNAVVTDIAVA